MTRQNQANSVGPSWLLPVIVVGQVLVTSTWFAANAVAPDIGLLWSAGDRVGQITLMVQLGFIASTLIVSTSGLADAISSGRLFLVSAILAAMINWAILYMPANYTYVLVCRFLTGAALAGVYPIGMKLAASWYAQGLGRALGFLVGALVLGTSLTHLLRATQIGMQWQYVIVASSLAAMVGGLLVCFVPDGPHHSRSDGQRLRLMDLTRAMANRDFRLAAFAYFGHICGNCMPFGLSCHVGFKPSN